MVLPRRDLMAGLAAAPLFSAFAPDGEAQAQPAVRTLILAMGTTPKGFDPDAWVPGQIESTVNIYEGLVRHPVRTGADGKPELDFSSFEPHFAESWTVSDDGLEYIFKLRPDVRSPFGNALTAEDITWTYQKSDSQRRTGLFMKTVAQIKSVEALAPDQVKFTLNTPNRIFLSVMALHIPALFDSTEAKKHALPDDPFATRWLGQNSCGYGPYHVQEVRQGQQAVFVANPNYVFPAPYYNRIVWREVPSAATRVALVRTGQVQYAEQIPLQQIAELRRDRNVRVDSVLGTASATVRMNPRLEPFTDVRVRQAVAYATDYDAIGTAVFMGLATRSRSVLAPKIPGYVESFTYETDYDKAKALLAEAGHAGGIDITLEYSTNWWWEEGVALQMQASLAKANIRATPKRIPPTEMTARRAVNVWSLPFITHWAASFVADPSYNLFLSTHSRGGSNVNGNNNPRLDALIDASISERDDTKWADLVAEAQREQARYAAIVELFLPGNHEVFAARVGGFTWYPHNRLAWKSLRAEG
ncbi:ABC transporter substrate-binding protein [Humitalea sp. 24SJ18S-53]|uniref:ABC transporter substrate-binding protein n=1 Tax=Humitalea sp. 24SJ18S-53 TaxID=3422307 RepID=UPI003D676254